MAPQLAQELNEVRELGQCQCPIGFALVVEKELLQFQASHTHKALI